MIHMIQTWYVKLGKTVNLNRTMAIIDNPIYMCGCVVLLINKYVFCVSLCVKAFGYICKRGMKITE